MYYMVNTAIMHSETIAENYNYWELIFSHISTNHITKYDKANLMLPCLFWRPKLIVKKTIGGTVFIFK